jgi:hypothetical protein
MQSLSKVLPEPTHPETNGPASRRHRPRPRRRRYRPLQQLVLPFPTPPQAQQLAFDFEAGYAPSVVVDNADDDIAFVMASAVLPESDNDRKKVG